MYGLLHRGSVKDILGQAGSNNPYLFHYSDRYSIFDWGEMPDQLDCKGASLAFMADFFFRQMGNPKSWKERKSSSNILNELQEQGIGHHCQGPCDESGELLNFKDRPTSFLKVYSVQIVRPLFRDGVYDYSAYKDKLLKTLVPLEAIFRFGVPKGSSLLKRTNDPQYCKSLGLSFAPKEGDRFEAPIIEYSTKLESSDEYVDYEKAQSMAGLTSSEFRRLSETLELLALCLKDIFIKVGIELWDGKFEFAFAPDLREDGERNFWMVDSIGPDELRLSYKGVQLSKENLRQCYLESPWHKALSNSKEIAKERKVNDWKKICLEEMNQAPQKLKDETRQAAEMMYQSLANRLSETYDNYKVFPNAWDLDVVIEKWMSLS